MLHVDSLGHVIDARITLKIKPHIEKGMLNQIVGIIVHETDSSTAQATFNSYDGGSNGAHFLIDKDGTVYQTASLLKQTWHVGILQSRCKAEHRCTPAENKLLSRWDPNGESRREHAKSFPDRYPSNRDSIGIELVGKSHVVGTGKFGKKIITYDRITADQNRSLKWLVAELAAVLGVSLAEIYRHPDVSRKEAAEAATAQW